MIDIYLKKKLIPEDELRWLGQEHHLVWMWKYKIMKLLIHLVHGSNLILLLIYKLMEESLFFYKMWRISPSGWILFFHACSCAFPKVKGMWIKKWQLCFCDYYIVASKWPPKWVCVLQVLSTSHTHHFPILWVWFSLSILSVLSMWQISNLIHELGPLWFIYFLIGAFFSKTQIYTVTDD